RLIVVPGVPTLVVRVVGVVGVVGIVAAALAFVVARSGAGVVVGVAPGKLVEGVRQLVELFRQFVEVLGEILEQLVEVLIVACAVPGRIRVGVVAPTVRPRVGVVVAVRRLPYVVVVIVAGPLGQLVELDCQLVEVIGQLLE